MTESVALSQDETLLVEEKTRILSFLGEDYKAEKITLARLMSSLFLLDKCTTYQELIDALILFAPQITAFQTSLDQLKSKLKVRQDNEIIKYHSILSEKDEQGARKFLSDSELYSYNQLRDKYDLAQIEL